MTHNTTHYTSATKRRQALYIDIHNHSLYGVDDGPENIAESIRMLEAAKAQHIDAVILTPHLRHGMFPYQTDVIEANFATLKAEAAKRGIDIKLYLGCEHHVDSDILEHIQSKRCHTLNDSEYVLTEYSHSTPYSYIKEYTHKLVSYGYQPIVAHIERYECFVKKPQLAEELSRMGALIQINADSVLGIDGKYLEKACRKLLKLGIADIIASDAHGMTDRMNHMDECYRYVAKKYGEAYANELCCSNPQMILEQTISGQSIS